MSGTPTEPYGPNDQIKIARDSASLRDTGRCPLCATPSDSADPQAGTTDPHSCWRCQLDLTDPRLAEVFQLGVDAAKMLDQRESQLRQLRIESIAKQERARAALTAPTVSETATPAPAPAPVPPPAPAPAPQASTPLPPLPETAAFIPPAPVPAPAPAPPIPSAPSGAELHPTAVSRPRRQLSPQAMLLTVGVSFVAIAAAVFLTVAFVVFNLATKAAIIGGLTVLSAVGSSVLQRTRLGRTAEAIAVLAVVLCVLDVWALDALGLLAATSLHSALIWGLGLTLLAAGWWAWGHITRLRAATVASACSIVPALSLLMLGLSNQFVWDPAALVIPLSLAAASAFAVAHAFRRGGKPLLTEQHLVQAMATLAAVSVMAFLFSAAILAQTAAGYRIVAAGVLLATWFLVALRWGISPVYRVIAAVSSVVAAGVFVLTAQVAITGTGSGLPWWCGGVLIAVAGYWWLLRGCGQLNRPVTVGATVSAIAAGCTVVAHFGWAINRSHYLSPVHTAERYLGSSTIDYGTFDPGFDLGLLTFATSSAAVALIIAALLQRRPVAALASRAGGDTGEVTGNSADPCPASAPPMRALAGMGIRQLTGVVFSCAALVFFALAFLAVPATVALPAFGVMTIVGVIIALRLPAASSAPLRCVIEFAWIIAAGGALLLAPVTAVPLFVVAAVIAVVLVRTVPLLGTRAAGVMPAAYGALFIPLVIHAGIASLSTQQLWPLTVLAAVCGVPAALLLLPERQNPTRVASFALAALACLSAGFTVLASWFFSPERINSGHISQAATTLGMPTTAAVQPFEQFPTVGVLIALLVAQLLLLTLTPNWQAMPTQLARMLAIPLAALAVALSVDGTLRLVFDFSNASHLITALSLGGVLAAGSLLAARKAPAQAKLGAAALVVLGQTVTTLTVILGDSTLREQPETVACTILAIVATAGIALFLHHPIRVSPAAEIVMWLVPTFIAGGIGSLLHTMVDIPLVTALPGALAFSVAAALLVVRRPSPGRSWAAAWLALGVLAVWQVSLRLTPTGTWALTTVELATLGLLVAILFLAAIASWPPQLAPLQSVAVCTGPVLTAASFVLFHNRFHESRTIDSMPVAALLIELGVICLLAWLFAWLMLRDAQRNRPAAHRGVSAAAFTVALLVLLLPVGSAWVAADAGFALPLLAAAVGAVLALLISPKPPTEQLSLSKLPHSPALPHFLVAASVLVLVGLSFFALDGRGFEAATSLTFTNVTAALLDASIAALSLAALRRGHHFVAAVAPPAIWLGTVQFSVPLFGVWWPLITATTIALVTVLTIRLRYRGAEPSPLPVRLTAALAAAIPGAAAAIPQLTQPMVPSTGLFIAAALGLLVLSLRPLPMMQQPVNPVRIALAGVATVAAMGMRLNAPLPWVELSALPLGLFLAFAAASAARARARWDAQAYALLAPVSVMVMFLPLNGVAARPIVVVAVATALALMAAVMAALTARHTRGDSTVAASLRAGLLQAFSLGAITAAAISQLAAVVQSEPESIPTMLLLLLPSLALLVATSFITKQMWLATAAAFSAQLLPSLAYIEAGITDIGTQYALMVPLSALAAIPIIALAIKPHSTARTTAMTAVGVGIAIVTIMGGSAIEPPEAVTIPISTAALTAGIIVLANTATARSWLTLGPGLAVLLGAGYVFEHLDTQPWRVILMSLLIAGALVFGAMRRLQAPIVLGTITGLAHAMLATRRAFPELVVPWWVWLAIVGAALIFIAATYEARRRQARALFASVSALR